MIGCWTWVRGGGSGSAGNEMGGLVDGDEWNVVVWACLGQGLDGRSRLERREVVSEETGQLPGMACKPILATAWTDISGH
jgi:hypothetical protein